MAVGTSITNKQFADKVGCHYSMASRLLNGLRLPSPEMMFRISEAYDIPLGDLMTARLEGHKAVGKLLRTRCKDK